MFINDAANNPTTLEELKMRIKAGENIVIEGSKNGGCISCMMAPDPLDGTIPRVIGSNHRRFTPGYRFDYGFMCVSIRDGFTIIYN